MRWPIRLCAWMWIGFSAAARADVSDKTFDTHKYIAGDIYDLTPDRRAHWEDGRYRYNGIWIGLGSVNDREFDAVERGVLNFPIVDWLQLHGDIRNDRDRDSSVRRMVFDLTTPVRPWLWLGASGSPPLPASDKGSQGLGAAALLVDTSRTRYLLMRVVLDSLFYNRLNEANGSRKSLVWHPQVEGHWEEGPWSAYGYFDLTTRAGISFAAGPIARQSNSRAEYSLHLRYAKPGLEGDARFDRVVTDDFRSGPRLLSQTSRHLSIWRLQSLFAPWDLRSPFRLRLEFRLVDEHGYGRDLVDVYKISRVETGGRVAAVWTRGPHLAEAGYASAVVSLALPVDGVPLRGRPYEDAAYVGWEYSLGPRFQLRARLVWEVRHKHFGGGNGIFLAQF